MNKQTFITSTEAKLKAEFPHLVFRLIPDPDDDATFFAYAFCVPDGSEEATKTLVRTFLRNLLDDISAYDVMPSVKNLTITKAYYPNLIT